ncbi:cellulose-binding protein [Methylocystis sp. B8]|uniref:cellulose-binding protein n=1 Tax=Methylocystis sp. B8 TaxID=544938 RepID=UPI0010FF5AF4|nr:cellulose-binding protein [Methylocystis sp. B8]TLG78816.1 cellulose-binding protein [Methylocystis sp. B8]
MRNSFKLTLGLALICALASSQAFAERRKPVATGQVTAAQGDDFPIALPHNLTTGKDWLDDGAGSAAQGNLGPNRYANDNYFLEQQDFTLQDPQRYNEIGQFFDYDW